MTTQKAPRTICDYFPKAASPAVTQRAHPPAAATREPPLSDLTNASAPSCVARGVEPTSSRVRVDRVVGAADRCSQVKQLSSFPRVVVPQSHHQRGGFTKGINTRERKKTPYCYCGQRMKDVLINHHKAILFKCAEICGDQSCNLRLHPIDDKKRYAAALEAARKPKPVSVAAVKALY